MTVEPERPSSLPAAGAGDVLESEAAVQALLESSAGQDVHVLRAVLRVTQAALGVQRLEDALEVIAEQSRQALDASSFSISRWERDTGVLRTLINVGDLGPGEERHPVDETYPLADYALLTDLLRKGEPYIDSIDQPGGTGLLERCGKESELAVPVVYDSRMWGELWATGTDGRRFSENDVRMLQAIAAQVSMAIGRAELFSEVSQYAFEDPLTRVANRRGLDERLRTVRHGEELTLVVCDVDGLKTVNDQDGHPAGDALLRGVADAMSTVASGWTGSLVARLGGDEFCVVLPGRSLAAAKDYAQEASRLLTTELGPERSVCWGASASRPGTSARELIAAADAALLDAKRLGPGRLRLSPDEHRDTADRRTSSPRGRRAEEDLLPRVVALLDERAPATSREALELLAYELSRIFNAAAWSLSETTEDGTGIRTIRGVESELDRSSGLRTVEGADANVYPLAEYPTTARALEEGAAFVVGVDAPGSDPAEVEVLKELGYRALLGVGTHDGKRGYLLEIYSDGDYAGLSAHAAHVRVLAHHCTRGRHAQMPRPS